MTDVYAHADVTARATVPMPIGPDSGARACARWQADHAAGGAVISAPAWRTSRYAFGQPNVRRLLARHDSYLTARALQEDVVELDSGYGMARGRSLLIGDPLRAGTRTVAGVWDSSAQVLEILPWWSPTAPPTSVTIAMPAPIRQKSGYLIVEDGIAHIVDLPVLRALPGGQQIAARATRLSRTLAEISQWTLTRDTRDEDLRVRPYVAAALALAGGPWTPGGDSAAALRDRVAARAHAPEHVDRARALLADLRPHGTGGFAEELQATLQRPWLAVSEVAVLGAAVARAADRKDVPVSRHVGAIGERDVFTVTVTRVVAGRAAQYGWAPRSLVVARADDGAVLVWRSSTPPAPGGQIRLRGRVQAHSHFGDVAQTELSHVRLIT